jgi:hypothetical protein
MAGAAPRGERLPVGPVDLGAVPSDHVGTTTSPTSSPTPTWCPSRGCPGDWPARLEDILTRSGSVKAGLGLRLDNLPVQNRDAITEREMTFWDAQWEPGAYHANIDTTLALYRPWTEYPLFSLGPAIRTGYPYLADHLAWHETGDPGPELRHYYQRADPGHGVTGRTVKE